MGRGKRRCVSCVGERYLEADKRRLLALALALVAVAVAVAVMVMDGAG